MSSPWRCRARVAGTRHGTASRARRAPTANGTVVRSSAWSTISKEMVSRHRRKARERQRSAPRHAHHFSRIKIFKDKISREYPGARCSQEIREMSVQRGSRAARATQNCWRHLAICSRMSRASLAWHRAPSPAHQASGKAAAGAGECIKQMRIRRRHWPPSLQWTRLKPGKALKNNLQGFNDYCFASGHKALHCAMAFSHLAPHCPEVRVI